MEFLEFRGRGIPVAMKYGDEYPRLEGCPSCEGRGWFLINPFATGGTNGAGGIGNMTPCLTCIDAKAYWDAHGELPPNLVAAIATKKAAKAAKAQK
jgi:hypothetical protein